MLYWRSERETAKEMVVGFLGRTKGIVPRNEIFSLKVLKSALLLLPSR